MVLEDEILKKSVESINYFAFLSSPLFKLFLTLIFVFSVPALIFIIGYNRRKIRGWFLFWFKREVYFKATIIMPNNQEIVYPTIIQNGRFKFMNCSYILDIEKLHYNKSIPVGSWFFNNPTMINFDRKNNSTSTLSADSLDGILDEKLINELQKRTDNTGTLMTIIIIISVINVILTILFSSGIIKIKGG